MSPMKGRGNDHAATLADNSGSGTNCVEYSANTYATALPTIEATGATAAQHLLRLAAGIGGKSALEILVELNVAVARSRAAGTLASDLSSLFASAVQAGWRAYCETSVGDPTKSQAEREIAILEAERIIEEELVVWKAKGESQRAVELEPSFYRRYGTSRAPSRLHE
jgi:glutamyl-tRNA reductase